MEYKSENKICQNCHGEFIIESEDFGFYEKMRVPPPTFCPECRIVRRMSFLNDRNFHKRKCDKTGEICVSLFSQDFKTPVYSPKAWWADDWDAVEYGQEYDFSKPFFEQFKELMERVPQFAMQSQYTTLINSEYTMMGTYNRNCFMVTNTEYSTDCIYTTFNSYSNNCLDTYMCHNSELCYQCINVRKCSRVIFSMDLEDCFDIAFSKNLRGCNNCFGCFNLRNKSYCFFNEQLSKEEYENKLKEYDTGSERVVKELLDRFEKESLKYPRKFIEGTKNVSVSGNYLYESKNAFECFDSTGLEDCKYCQFCFLKPTRDSYDMTQWGGNARFVYDCMGAGDNETMVKFSIDCWAQGSNIEYSYHIVSPNDDIFGCIGLKHKRYCILNKQYTEEEYKELIPKIKQHMDDMPYVDKKGKVYKYGEFFPSELSFFGYNETLAYSYFPLSKQEAEKKGLNWTETKINKHEITTKSSELPDNIKDVKDDILNEVIEDEQSRKPYKIVAQELKILRRLNVPLPRRHHNERHYLRVAKRNPLKLWHRQCMCDKKHAHHAGQCKIEFETSYAPDRPEIIYCEKCYQQEVY
jgi:hypothetical protein